MLSHPSTQLLVLGMTPIVQCFQQMSISPNTTAIFGRTGTCTIQAAWNNHILIQGLKVFHCNHCQQLVFFESTQCVHCGRTLAFLPDLQIIESLDSTGEDLWSSPASRQLSQPW